MGIRMGRRFIFLAVAIMLMGGFDLAHAAYVIKLKNGNEYATTRYWQEGGQVFFDTYGGVFGVERSFISKIEKTDQAIQLAAAGNHGSVESAPPILSNQNDQSVGKVPTEEKASEAKPDPDDPVVGEFNRLKEKSKEVDGMLTSEIRELLNQITAFKNKLSKDSKLFFAHGREFNDANELGAAVESALRTRTQ
jgi:hypothetical protein